MTEHKVYHIRVIGNESLNEGYIGVTAHLDVRMSKHRKSGLLRSGREFVILKTFSRRSKAYKLEKKLRPHDAIGWNRVKGGIKSGQIKKGQRLSPDTEFKKGIKPHNLGTGKKYLLTSPEGEEYYVDSLCKFCEAHNLTPQNLRKVAKGQRNYHKGWSAKEVLTGR